MQNKDESAKASVWRTVLGFNEACVRGGGFERLAPVVHQDVVFIPPGFAGRIQGRDKLLGMYTEACSGMKIEKMDSSEQQIEVFGDTAVVSYRYDTVWEARGRRNTQEGREILVFTREGDAWRLCWRFLQPHRRDTEVVASEAPAEASGGASPEGVLGECLSLMSKSYACYLSTIDGQGFPETTGMDNLRNAERFPALVPLFAEHQDDFVVYLSTFMFSEKVRRIQGNGKASLYYCDPDAVFGLMLVGQVELVEDPSLKDRIWQDGWTIYYPSGKDGPEYAALSFRPHLARGWGNSGPFEFQLPITGKDQL